jgi:uncharacterized protein YqeY
MNLFEQIKAERIEAMKNKNTIKKDLLGCVIAEASKEDKIPSDEKVLGTIRKFIKGSKEVQQAVECGSPDYKKAFEEEEILECYLPQQIDEGTIRNIFKLNTFANINKAMGYFKANYAGQYDGALVSKIAKELL